MFAAACASGDSGTPQGPGDDTPRVGPVRIIEKADVSVAGELERSAVDYVRSYDSNLRLTDKDDFSLLSSRLGADKRTHVRLQQTYEGIPVWGSDIVVHAAEGKFRGLNGTLAVHLPDLDINPSIDSARAMAIGKQLYAGQSKDNQVAGLKYAREKSDLVVFPRQGRDAALAWHVVFFTELQGGIGPGLWNYFIDAHSGDVLHSFNAIDTLEQASGPGGNEKTPRTWTMALDVEPSGGQYIMETARQVTVDMQNGTSGGVVVTGPLDPIGDAPINDAHGFAEVMLNMMQEWYGHNSIDDNGFVIRSRVHYSTSYENAFWDGEQMTYGDGASYFYPLSGDVDVVAHEISHGYTSFHSNLTYSGQSGGMNESFSDIAGTIAEHYAEGDAADWDLGTDIFRQENAALRYMCDPTADGASIDNLNDYYDGLDVHYSSGIGNKAFCFASRRFANNGSTDADATAEAARRVGEAFYEANASYWTASSSYQESCQGTMDAAAALGFSEQEREWLTLSWQDVGVYCDGAVEPIICDETLTAESGTLTSPNYPNAYPDNFSHIWCIQPASGQPATLHFDAFNTESGYDFVTIKDANGAVLSTTSGTTAPADATSTLIAVKFTSDGSVTATGWSATWSTDGTTNQAPTVSITEPADGATVSGDVVVAATAADADGTVARVSFALPDGTTVEDDSAPYEVAWDSTTVADGAAVISATAYDNVGASSSASVNVTVENGTSCVNGTYSATGLPAAIPDNSTMGVRSDINVDGVGNVGTIALSMTISHTYIGDLKVVLVSPSGTRYLVHNRSGGSADNIVITDLPLGVFTGEPVNGRWRLRAVDLAGYDTGTLDSWSLTITGDCDGSGGWGASDDPNLPTVDNGSVCTSVTVGSKGEASAAKLDISGVHDWRSVLRGTLEHNGTVVDAFPVGTFPSQAGPFEFTDRPVEGITGSAEGVWTLCVIDTDGYGDTGTLAHWAVHE